MGMTGSNGSRRTRATLRTAPRKSRLGRVIVACSTIVAVVLVGVGVIEATGVRVAGDHGRAGRSQPDTYIRFVRPEHGFRAGDPVSLAVQVRGERLVIDALEGDSLRLDPDVLDDTYYVMFQLDRGRYDHPRWVDTRRDERVLGLDPDQHLLIETNPSGAQASMPPGEYSPSIDGKISYHGIPGGRHTIRAYLIRADHTDRGMVAEMTFTVS